MKVSAQYAEAHFADLLHAAHTGEEVEIARPDQPTYHLTLVAAGPRKPKAPRILGAGVGEMTVPSWEEWKAVDKELEREVNDAPLVSGKPEISNRFSRRCMSSTSGTNGLRIAAFTART